MSQLVLLVMQFIVKYKKKKRQVLSSSPGASEADNTCGFMILFHLLILLRMQHAQEILLKILILSISRGKYSDILLHITRAERKTNKNPPLREREKYSRRKVEEKEKGKEREQKTKKSSQFSQSNNGKVEGKIKERNIL